MADAFNAWVTVSSPQVLQGLTAEREFSARRILSSQPTLRRTNVWPSTIYRTGRASTPYRSKVTAAVAVEGTRKQMNADASSQTGSTIGESVFEDRAVPSLPPITESKRVVLVRHGESTWNQIGRIQGSSDFAVLTPKGEIQAETSRQMLMDASFDAMFHSPLARAKRTAEIIWGSRSAPVHTLDDLREIDLYSFQGLMKHEGKEKYGDAYRMWQIDAANFCIDDHYPVRELWARAQTCWQEILSCPARSVLVVAHNAVNQALVATATGLGPEYFRKLLQSNCGISVIDFTPSSGQGQPPSVRLDRLNQTPFPPVASGQSGGRKAKSRLILVCHGATESSSQHRLPQSDDEPMTMLGVIQARKTAELLLDTRVDVLLTSPLPRAAKTAEAIAEVQAAAQCLGVRNNCRPNYCDTTAVEDLREMELAGSLRGKPKSALLRKLPHSPSDNNKDIDGNGSGSGSAEPTAEEGAALLGLWARSQQAWKTVLGHLNGPPPPGEDEESLEDEDWTVVAVGDEMVHVAMVNHCLGTEGLDLYRLDTGSISVVDFPDGPVGRGVVRCLNYTAHLGRWAVPVTRPTLGDEDF